MAVGENAAPATHDPKQSKVMVILASSLGTMFEWFDFYLYGLLAGYIPTQFFSGVNETTDFILALAAFAAGFADLAADLAADFAEDLAAAFGAVFALDLAVVSACAIAHSQF